MAPNRYYTSDALPTTLAASLSSVTPGASGSVELASITGYPTSYPFTLLLEWGTASQEVVTVTQAATGSGPYTFASCTRGDDGSASPAHASGAAVAHGVSARDFAEPQAHLGATSNVHGVSGSLATAFLPMPSGTPAAGQLPFAAGTGNASAWSYGYPGATILIAASDASPAAQAAASYVCTGSADNTVIDTAIAAIAALSAGGGTVLLSEGTFVEADSALITASNIRVLGSGRATLVKITGAVSHLHVISAAGSSGSPLTGIYVGNLTVMGYGDDQNSGALAYGVSMAWCNNSTIENVWGHDVTWAVAGLNDCQRCIVNNIHAEAGTLGTSGGWYGVTAYNGDISGFYAGHVISNVTSQAAHHAVAMQSVSHAVVSGVTAMSMADTAGDPYVLNWQGCDNIVATGITGINVPGLFYLEEGCDKCSLTNFSVLASQSAGEDVIFVSDSTNSEIADGFIDATSALTYDAIQVDSTSSYGSIRGVVIKSSARYGINVVSGASDWEISGNIVKGTTSDGIVAGGANSRVYGNHVETAGANGIRVPGHFSRVLGNVLLSNTGAGILVDFGSGSVVDDNALLLNTGYGVTVNSGASAAVLGLGNTYSSNTAGTVSDSGTSTVRNDTQFAPLASPALTGSPTAPTQSGGDTSTKIATDAFVAAAVAARVPLTTAGDLLYENATPAPARLAAGAAGQVLGMSSGLPAWGAGMTLLASTGTAGYTLINGTGNIISWTAPNDGALHRVMAIAVIHVTSSQTGGAAGLALTLPDGTSFSPTLLAGAQGVGGHSITPAAWMVEANTTVTVQQTTAQTGGAAVAWIELWGS